MADERGRVRIDGVPDGQADVRLWHPDQLVDQPPMRVQVAASVEAGGKLNFTPRRRAAPVRGSPKGEYDVD